MEGPFTKYFELQQIIQSDIQLKSKLEQILLEENPQISVEKLNKRFPYEEYLMVCWTHLYETLSPLTVDEAAHAIKSIDFSCLYGSLYLTLMFPDVSEPSESPVLIAFGVFLEIIRLMRWNSHLEKQDGQVFALAIHKMHSRDMAEWPPSISILNSCLKVLLVKKMDESEVTEYMRLVMYFAENHFEKLDDGNEKCIGALAFDCLRAVIMMDFGKGQEKVLLSLLQSIMRGVEYIDGLNKSQCTNRISNFEKLFSDSAVHEKLCSHPLETSYAVVGTAKVYSKSKLLAFIINQLPFRLVDQIVRHMSEVFKLYKSLELQMFAFHMIETPHLTEDEDELQKYAALYKFMIVQFVLEPFYDTESMSSVVGINIKLFYDLLLIPNLFIRELLKAMSPTNFKPYLRKLADLCDVQWRLEYKIINQKFISIYCRVLVIDVKARVSNAFETFKLLMKHATANNLAVCNTDFQVLSNKLFRCDDLVLDVAIALTYVCSRDTPNTLPYLRMLSRILFSGAGMGDDFYRDIISVTDLGPIIIKKIAHHKLITEDDMEMLTMACQVARSWRLLCELPLHMDLELNPHLVQFTQQLHHSRRLWLKRKELLYAVQFFGHILDRHHLNCSKVDKESYMRFGVFLESVVINRDAHKHIIPSALVTLRKYHEYYQTPLERVGAMFDEITNWIVRAFSELVKYDGEFERVRIISRDLCYYGEILMVFGDFPLFKCKPLILEVTEVALNYLLTATFESGVSQFAADMIRCMVRIAIRNEHLLPLAVSAVTNIFGKSNTIVKQCCLECLHDVALYRTSNYELMVPYIFDMLLIDDTKTKCGGINAFAKIYLKDEITIVEWQTFVIALAFGSDPLVKRNIRRRYQTLLFEKLSVPFGAHFMHTFFYLNGICNHPDHVLLEQYRSKVIKGEVTLNVRCQTYELLVSHMVPASHYKILNYLYKTLHHKYFTVGTEQCLITDILEITYIILRDRREDYPECNKTRYLTTMTQIEKLKTVGIKKIGSATNVDPIIENIIKKIVILLSQWTEVGVTYIIKAIHTLCAIINWYFPNIYNAVVDDGRNSELRKSVLSIPEYYNALQDMMELDEY